MKPTALLLALAVSLGGGLAAIPDAEARDDRSWRHDRGSDRYSGFDRRGHPVFQHHPGDRGRVVKRHPPPRQVIVREYHYYQPAPVYRHPPPRYYSPPPRYYSPPPRYYSRDPAIVIGVDIPPLVIPLR
ncbi:MAG: hypothetical protein ACK4KV_19230 [Rhodocyclaceae bacterium]